tara:strand:+ start:1274 stop:1471 length:198 start_codon:yes stop_codon:yes gene_type:complete
LYDTYQYYKFQSNYIHTQIEAVYDIQNYLNLVLESQADKDAINYGKLHVAKSFWELRRDEALLIE